MVSRRVLSIDGGGIKGVIPASFLAAIEEATGKRILDHFDLIVGTSTGGIIALGLALGLPALDLLRFYEEKGPAIFGPSGSLLAKFLPTVISLSIWRLGRSLRWLTASKYDPAQLRAALEQVFGSKRIGDCRTRVVIPAFDRERREVHLFKTAHHPRLAVDYKVPIVDAALATAAAPSYLPHHRTQAGISLLDGGIWANNPVAVAVTEAVGVLRWEPSEVAVLSLGCSEAALNIPESGGAVQLMAGMADIFLLGQSHGAHGMAKLLLRAENDPSRLQRFQPHVPHGRFALDAVARIQSLRGIGAALAREALPSVTATFFQGPVEQFEPLKRL